MFGPGEGRFLREGMCLYQKKKGKSKVLSRGFCLFDSETEQRALQFLHIYCSDERSHSSAPESNKRVLVCLNGRVNVQGLLITSTQHHDCPSYSPSLAFRF